MLINKKVYIVFFAVIVLVSFFLVSAKKTNALLTCWGAATYNCPAWRCKILLDVPICEKVRSTYQQECNVHTLPGGQGEKCGFYYDSRYSCVEDYANIRCIIDDCTVGIPGEQNAFYQCSTSSTSTPTPTPTPTPSCKSNGEYCGGGGSGCCSGYCNLSINQCANPPAPTPSCKSNGEYCGGGGSGCCSGYCNLSINQCANPPAPTPTNVPPPTSTPTPIPPTPTPTSVPAVPWFKLKDASLVGNTSINSPIPASPLTPYDADDPGNRYLIDSSAGSDPGVATGQTISVGGAPVSVKNWKATGTSYSPQYTVSKFIDYVRTKKAHFVVEISNIADIQEGMINIISGNQTIAEADLSGKRPLVVIVEGNITLSGATLNSTNLKQIIMSTGTITFPTTMSAANGFYIADSLDFGTTANQGIKIIGNAIAQSSFTSARQWSNAKRPGLFIVFDPSHYLESFGGVQILEMFSTVTYDWRQIQ